jgi:uncharacterized protein YndB with AHSA1/START domain
MSELKIERHFPNPPETVFAFVTKMEHLLKWWGPEGTEISEHQLDLTRPGAWFFVIVDPKGGRHRVSGEVIAIDPPHSVDFTLIVHTPDGGHAIDSAVRFEVRPDGAGGTHFLLIQTGVPEAQMAAMSTQGWVSTLGRLEALLNDI